MTIALSRPAISRLVPTRLIFAAALAAVPSLPAFAESAQVAEGARLYAETCAVCHGADGRGGAGYPNPIWGDGAQIAKFSHAQGLFEYNQLLMPFDDPTKLDSAEKWAVVVYILANHDIIARDDEVSRDDAASIEIQ
jgi:mono/diheme cytochrome c family protein